VGKRKSTEEAHPGEKRRHKEDSNICRPLHQEIFLEKFKRKSLEPNSSDGYTLAQFIQLSILDHEQDMVILLTFKMPTDIRISRKFNKLTQITVRTLPSTDILRKFIESS
jgi:hypothetical protein